MYNSGCSPQKARSYTRRVWPFPTRAPLAAQTRFPLMAWDYAEEKEAFEAMRDAGITSVAFVPVKALDLCHECDLQAIVHDERISGATYHGPFDGDAVARNLPEILKEVGDHPAVLGYHLRDEPSPEQYPDLAKGIAAVHDLAPGKWAYVNLLPGDGEPAPHVAESPRDHLLP